MTDVLDAELWARIAHLRITARALADSVFAGAHPSRRVGASIDFAEHREYRPGDDPRTLDSRVYARTDRWVVRRFEHEAEVRAYVALDTSGSMQFRSAGALPTKLEHARRILLGFAYLLLRQGDRVGGLDLVRGAPSLVPPGSSLAQIDRIREGFGVPEAASTASLAQALHLLASVSTRRALIVVATDALDEASGLDELAALRANGHSVVFVHVLDPLELDFDLDGAHEFVGLERDGRIVADTALVREAYLEEVRRFLDETRERCASAGAHYLLARTDVPPEECLGAIAMLEGLT